MCTVLGVARSTYYKYFCKTKSAIEIENEELKKDIIRIYKVNKGIMEYRGFSIYFVKKALMCL